jgi:aryl-alcohol dehydrogenase-like predicted oxidoreductase
MDYFAGIATDDHLLCVELLTEFAADHGRGIVELALSWLASQAGGASVLVGATKPEQVRANVGSIGWTLTTDERATVDAILRGHLRT